MQKGGLLHSMLQLPQTNPRLSTRRDPAAAGKDCQLGSCAAGAATAKQARMLLLVRPPAPPPPQNGWDGVPHCKVAGHLSSRKRASPCRSTRSCSAHPIAGLVGQMMQHCQSWRLPTCRCKRQSKQVSPGSQSRQSNVCSLQELVSPV